MFSGKLLSSLIHKFHIDEEIDMQSSLYTLCAIKCIGGDDGDSKDQRREVSYKKHF